MLFLDKFCLSEYDDVEYISKFRWLTKAATLKRFQLLLPEKEVFLVKKKKNVIFYKIKNS